MHRSIRVPGLVVLLAAGLFGQQTLRVPAGVATIQAAIQAASAGDTVLVDPGTYVENIDFLGKDIVVRSAQGASVTVIDGSRSGSVVTFASGEPPTATLEGFTVTNGSGSFPMFPLMKLGGGIYVSGASTGATIRSCDVTGNHMDNSGPLSGGALSMIGAGIFIDGGDVSIIGCRVSGNSAVRTEGMFVDARGGGIAVFDPSGPVLVEGCEVSDNALIGPAGCVGGGIYACEPRGLVVRDTVIDGNRAGGPASISRGGGVYTEREILPTSIVRCRITGNVASGATPAGATVPIGGGGLHLYAATGTMVRDSVIAGNHTDARGGGALVIIPTARAASLIGCTVADNTAGESAGGLLLTGLTNGVVSSSIVWNNAPGQVVDELSFGVTVRSCDVQGGFPGPGNIDADPLFFDAPAGDHRLTVASPCRDAGDPSDVAPGDRDVEGDPRRFNGGNDMGADEFFGLGACAAGEVGGGSGGPFDVLTINGSSGLPDRRVVAPIGTVFTIGVALPPAHPGGAGFIVGGYLGVPDSTLVTALPFGLGDLCFPSELLTPGVAAAFTLTSSYAPVPGQLVASAPAPWSLVALGPPVPLALTFQGVIDETPGQPKLTNGVVVELR